MSKKIETQWWDIKGPQGEFKGYFAAPESDTTLPGVIVIQEIFGVNVHIRDITERIAAEGYAALAPDMFWRLEPGYEGPYNDEGVAKGVDYRGKTNPEDSLSDIQAAAEVLQASSYCKGEKLGMIGFCFGGFLSYLSAAKLSSSFAALSSYYGGGIAEYLEEAKNVNTSLQMHFGDKDATIPIADVQKIAAALQNNPRTAIFRYPEGDHGFNCDKRASYHQPSAKLAWERSMELFKTHLQVPKTS